MNEDGTLTYTFVEGVKATYLYYVIRVMGGALYLFGMLVMLWNVIMTATQGKAAFIAIPSLKSGADHV